METFAEAWVAANTTTPITEGMAVPVDQQQPSQQSQSQPSPDPSPGTPGAGLSIPIRCVVERQASSLDATKDLDTGVDGASAGASKQLNTSLDHQRHSPNVSGTSPQSAAGSNVEQNSYAIIASTVLFADLLRTALTKLGYSASEAVGAKGKCTATAIATATATANPNQEKDVHEACRRDCKCPNCFFLCLSSRRRQRMNETERQ